MKGLLIVLFALCMFAFGKCCCDEKRPNADTALQRPANTAVQHHS